LEWKVPYEKGALEAVGYGKGGKELLRFARRTASAPAAIRLEIDRIQGREGASDVMIVNAAIVDRQGETCPRADDEVEFTVEGPGELLGVGNGNPLSHEPDKGTNRRMAYHGLCQTILQRTGSGAVTVQATSRMLSAGHVAC
jgi:beta-galactosidase